MCQIHKTLSTLWCLIYLFNADILAQTFPVNCVKAMQAVILRRNYNISKKVLEGCPHAFIVFVFQMWFNHVGVESLVDISLSLPTDDLCNNRQFMAGITFMCLNIKCHTVKTIIHIWCQGFLNANNTLCFIWQILLRDVYEYIPNCLAAFLLCCMFYKIPAES